MDKIVNDIICAIEDTQNTELVLNEHDSYVYCCRIHPTSDLVTINKKINIRMLGSGAKAKVMIFCRLSKHQRLNLIIEQEHVSHHAESEVIVKALLDDYAILYCACSINVAKQTVQNKATLAVKTILLSSSVRATLKPQLEILTEDALCKHSASCEAIHDEHLLYLQSRGVPRSDALAVLHKAFLEETE
jgi:Fe-S cluster assembly protein SufD